jgi:hypothetical protein
MQKVWMVWQTVDFGQDWMMGVFSTEAKAEAAMADMFADWLSDRGMTAAQFKASQDAPVLGFDMIGPPDDPFFVTDAVVK